MPIGVIATDRLRQGQDIIRVDLDDLDQGSGLAGQFGRIVQHLHPVVFVQAEHIITAEAGGLNFIRGAVCVELGNRHDH